MARRLTLDGTIRGRRIDLSSETGIPDGTLVQVTVEASLLTLAEKRATIRLLCGVWANDDSIEAIFKEIEHERKNSNPRPVDFDSLP